MPLAASVLDALAPLHLAGLNRIRNTTAMVLARRDKGAPVMRETRNLAILDAQASSARLFTPVGALPVGPALIFFHGGGFVLGGLESHEALCRRLADVSGLRVILATYRLAPEHVFPAQIEDAEVTVRWVLAHAADLGIDPAHLALGGDSAGGYLAIAVTRMLNQQTPGAIKAQVLFYPLMHLEDAAWADSVFKDFRVLGRAAIRYINAQFAGAPPPSLLGSADALTPPTIITVGGQMDPVRPDVLTYAEELRAAGIAVTLFEHPLLPHGFGNLTHVAAEARTALAEVGEALKRTPGLSQA